MKIRPLNTESNGARSFEIRAGELAYRSLLRRIKNIPEVTVMESAHDPVNDNTMVTIRYKGTAISIDTPFSDYIIRCESPDNRLDEFVRG